LRGVSVFGASSAIGAEFGTPEISRIHRSCMSQYGNPNPASMSARNMNSKKKTTARSKAEEVFIPEKLYFRIGEVASLCRLPAYVLRFWESEFPQLKPVKSSTGQRMYRKRDVENVLRIKQLLYEQGFTIVGARQQLRSESKTDKGQAAIPFPTQSPSELQNIRQGLREILKMLSARKTG
jgi:DNA-binding transcriptional MerR regulator